MLPDSRNNAMQSLQTEKLAPDFGTDVNNTSAGDSVPVLNSPWSHTNSDNYRNEYRGPLNRSASDAAERKHPLPPSYKSLSRNNRRVTREPDMTSEPTSDVSQRSAGENLVHRNAPQQDNGLKHARSRLHTMNEIETAL